MTKKQYKICRISIVFILSFLIGLCISLENYYLPVVFVVTAMAAMYYCRKQLQTNEVMVDERDYKVAGDAARYSITVFGTVGALLMFILMAISGKEGALYVASQTLAYSVCFIMLLNAFIFKYLSKRGK